MGDQGKSQMTHLKSTLKQKMENHNFLTTLLGADNLEMMGLVHLPK
jgi:hypothetical protein